MNNTNGKKGPVCFEDLDFRFKTHFEIINRKSKSSQQQSTRLVGCAKKRNVLINQYDQIQNITGTIQLSATPQQISGAFSANQYAWAAPNSSGWS
ncbi:MAG: hypothetical protein IKY09_02525, partial [Methanocorpusculum sp.]|nr:hypothetical protein [Methanocorpusculum sp.]